MGRTGFVRERILDAAFDCFAKEGYEAVSTRDIAKAANVGHASMYKHFPSKEELGKEVYRVAMQPLLAACFDLSESAASAQKAILAICAYLYQLYDERPRALALLIFPPHEFTPWELAKKNPKSPRSILLTQLEKNIIAESIIWGCMCGPLQDRYLKRLSGSMAKHASSVQRQISYMLDKGFSHA